MANGIPDEIEEEYDEKTIAVAETIATLAIEGYFSASDLLTLHYVIGDNMTGIVAVIIDHKAE